MPHDPRPMLLSGDGPLRIDVPVHGRTVTASSGEAVGNNPGVSAGSEHHPLVAQRRIRVGRSVEQVERGSQHRALGASPVR